VIANYNRVTSQAEDISYALGICQEKVSLEGNSIAIATRHLQYRFATSFFDDLAPTKRRKVHHRTLMVCNIQRVHLIFEKVNMMEQLLDICSFGWTNLAGYYELAGAQQLLEI
jgi:hypothetical protein